MHLMTYLHHTSIVRYHRMFRFVILEIRHWWCRFFISYSCCCCWHLEENSYILTFVFFNGWRSHGFFLSYENNKIFLRVICSSTSKNALCVCLFVHGSGPWFVSRHAVTYRDMGIWPDNVRYFNIVHTIDHSRSVCLVK